MDFAYSNIDNLKALHCTRGNSKVCAIYVHGGPGYGVSLLGSERLLPMFPETTDVLFFDQSYCGKSFSFGGLFKPQSITQHLNDLIKVTRSVAKKYNFVVLVCHSWGTILGLRLINFKIDLPLAYVGLGQVVNGVEAEKFLFDKVFEACSGLEGNEQNLLSPYSSPVLKKGAAVIPYLSRSRRMALSFFEPFVIPLEDTARNSKLYKRGDVLKMKLGFLNAVGRLWGECLSTKFDEPNSLSVEVPCEFLTGASDVITPGYLVDRMIQVNNFSYFVKHTLIDNGGHRINLTHCQIIKASIERIISKSI